MNRKVSDILIRIEKDWGGDMLNLRIWHNGFETSYPSMESFLDDIKKHIVERVKVVKY